MKDDRLKNKEDRVCKEQKEGMASTGDADSMIEGIGESKVGNANERDAQTQAQILDNVDELLAALTERLKYKLPREASRILKVKGLPFALSAGDLYEIFGKQGSVRQIRQGATDETKGSALVVYDDVYDANNALKNLSGFNVAGRYLTVTFFNPAKERRRARRVFNEEAEQILKQKARL